VIDKAQIGHHQRIKLYEAGVLLLIDNEKHTEIKLDAQASMQVFAFLLLHQDRLTQYVRSQE
jgi:hypothetical protein